MNLWRGGLKILTTPSKTVYLFSKQLLEPTGKSSLHNKLPWVCRKIQTLIFQRLATAPTPFLCFMKKGIEASESYVGWQLITLLKFLSFMLSKYVCPVLLINATLQFETELPASCMYVDSFFMLYASTLKNWLLILLNDLNSFIL